MKISLGIALLAVAYKAWRLFLVHKIYPSRNTVIQTHMTHGLKQLPVYQEILSSEDPVNVLDFGCGQGDTAVMIRNIFGDKVNITSLDVYLASRWSADEATTRVLYDGDVIPYDENYFRLAFAGQVLHHIPDNKHSVTDLARVAQNILIVEDLVQHGTLQSYFCFFWDSLWNADWLKSPPHSNRDHNEWPALFEALGIKLVKTHYFSLVFARDSFDETPDSVLSLPLANVVYSLASHGSTGSSDQ